MGQASRYPPSLKGPDVARTMRETGVTIVPAVPQLMVGFDRWNPCAHGESAGAAPLAARALRAAGAAAAAARLEPRTAAVPARPPGGRAAPEAPRIGWRRARPGRGAPAVVARLQHRRGLRLDRDGPTISFDSPEHPCFGSVGLPLPGLELRLTEPDASGVGEIVVRSPSLFDGYLTIPTPPRGCCTTAGSTRAISPARPRRPAVRDGPLEGSDRARQRQERLPARGRGAPRREHLHQGVVRARPGGRWPARHREAPRGAGPRPRGAAPRGRHAARGDAARRGQPDRRQAALAPPRGGHHGAERAAAAHRNRQAQALRGRAGVARSARGSADAGRVAGDRRARTGEPVVARGRAGARLLAGAGCEGPARERHRARPRSRLAGARRGARRARGGARHRPARGLRGRGDDGGRPAGLGGYADGERRGGECRFPPVDARHGLADDALAPARPARRGAVPDRRVGDPGTARAAVLRLPGAWPRAAAAGGLSRVPEPRLLPRRGGHHAGAAAARAAARVVLRRRRDLLAPAAAPARPDGERDPDRPGGRAQGDARGGWRGAALGPSAGPLPRGRARPRGRATRVPARRRDPGACRQSTNRADLARGRRSPAAAPHALAAPRRARLGALRRAARVRGRGRGAGPRGGAHRAAARAGAGAWRGAGSRGALRRRIRRDPALVHRELVLEALGSLGAAPENEGSNPERAASRPGFAEISKALPPRTVRPAAGRLPRVDRALRRPWPNTRYTCQDDTCLARSGGTMKTKLTLTIDEELDTSSEAGGAISRTLAVTAGRERATRHPGRGGVLLLEPLARTLPPGGARERAVSCPCEKAPVIILLEHSTCCWTWRSTALLTSWPRGVCWITSRRGPDRHSWPGIRSRTLLPGIAAQRPNGYPRARWPTALVLPRWPRPPRRVCVWHVASR